MKILLTIFFIITASLLLAQQNLVKNPSFEDKTGDPSPGSWAMLDYASYWHAAAGSPDYYNSTYDTVAGVPDNWGGHSFAFDGHAFGGLFLYYHFVNNIYVNNTEVMRGTLLSTLIKDKHYKVSFYIKLVKNSMYAVNNIGCFLSDSSHFNPEIAFPIPQICYYDTILNDSINWNKIEGEFISKGNENFLFIGKILPDSITSISLVNSFAPEPAAYYYIDNVSVEEISTDTIDTIHHEQYFNIYPSPAQNEFSIEYNNLSINSTVFTLTDMSGRKVKQIQIPNSSGKIIVNVLGICSGLYNYSISDDQTGTLKSDRIMIIK